MSKLGAVIQGPLRSVGISGAQRLFAKSDITDYELTSWDCIETIKSSYSKLQRLGIPTVVSTWNDELVKDVALHVPSVDLVFQNLPSSVNKNSMSSSGRRNNKDLQALSTLAGIEILERRGCTHALKIRSDMQIDVEAAFDSFLSMPLSICFAPLFIEPRRPSHIDDLIYIARIPTLKWALSEMLRHPRANSAHTDFQVALARSLGVVKSAREVDALAVGEAQNSWVHVSATRARSLLRLWDPNIFCVLDEPIFASAIWRGRPLATSGDEVFSVLDARAYARRRLLMVAVYPLLSPIVRGLKQFFSSTRRRVR